MTYGEKMVWAVSFVHWLRYAEARKMAAGMAARAVEDMREIRGELAATRGECHPHVEMLDEMLGDEEHVKHDLMAAGSEALGRLRDADGKSAEDAIELLRVGLQLDKNFDETQQEKPECEDSNCLGWDVFNDDEIQRCNTCEQLPSDTAALAEALIWLIDPNRKPYHNHENDLDTVRWSCVKSAALEVADRSAVEEAMRILDEASSKT